MRGEKVMFPNIFVEYFSHDDLNKAIHFPRKFEHAVNWVYFTRDWWGEGVNKEGDLSIHADKLAGVLKNEFGVKEKDKVFLYSGSRDWNLSSIEEHARILDPVIYAIMLLKAKPILLSCFCECEDYEKRRLVKIFNITLGYQKPF